MNMPNYSSLTFEYEDNINNSKSNNNIKSNKYQGERNRALKI